MRNTQYTHKHTCIYIGTTITEIMKRSGARLQINQDFPDGVPRTIMATGYIYFIIIYIVYM